jgi:hypothetical protein
VVNTPSDFSMIDFHPLLRNSQQKEMAMPTIARFGNKTGAERVAAEERIPSGAEIQPASFVPAGHGVSDDSDAAAPEALILSTAPSSERSSTSMDVDESRKWRALNRYIIDPWPMSSHD